jgi:hypothetical protein
MSEDTSDQGAIMQCHANSQVTKRDRRPRFTFGRSSRDDALARHVITEYRRGASLADVLDAPYVRNRTDASARRRLLDRSDVIEAIGAEVIAQLESHSLGRTDRSGRSIGDRAGPGRGVDARSRPS